jgi:hypothetical protein
MAQRAKLQLHPTHAPRKAASKGAGSVREAGKSTRAKAREGTCLVGAHVPEALWKELGHLRTDLGLTMQALVVEALEDVVAKHRRR